MLSTLILNNIKLHSDVINLANKILPRNPRHFGIEYSDIIFNQLCSKFSKQNVDTFDAIHETLTKSTGYDSYL